MTRERNKPTESFIERANNELANEKELTIARAYELGRIRGYKEAIKMAKEWLKNNVSDYSATYIVGCSKGAFISDFESDMNKLLEEKK